MKILTMYRKSFPDSSRGAIILHQSILYTMEQPWTPTDGCRAGKPFKSCIPTGLYELVDHESPRYGKTKALVNHSLGVYQYEHEREFDTDRYACLIHAANFVRDVQGCIAPGTGVAFNHQKKQFMVTSSRVAMNWWNNAISRDNFTHLRICDYDDFTD